MDLLFSLYKTKKNKTVITDIKMLCDDSFITIKTNTEFTYFKNIEIKKNITFKRELILELSTGDIEIRYTMFNDENPIVNTKTKNNFSEIQDFIIKGLIHGEKTPKYWGVVYIREIKNLFLKLKNELIKKGLNYIEKDVSCVNFIFDLIVDYHLYKKNIKGHNTVYKDIINEYPKKKWLKLNDNKFLPSILDSYKIKSKTLLKNLNIYFNNGYNSTFHYRSLKFICNLFGDDFPHYLNELPHVFFHCNVNTPNRKTYTLKNKYEKRCMVELFKNWEKNYLQINPFIKQVHSLLEMREFLEKKGMEMKFNVTNDSEFLERFNEWYSLKSHYNRGFKIMVNYSKELIDEIQKEIVINNQTYRAYLLKSEDDFRLEGHNMKNCMGNQFIHGLNSMFIVVIHNGKRYNLQFNQGELKQIYGKANQVVTPGTMDDVINELTKKISKFNEVKIGWNKIKYNFI